MDNQEIFWDKKTKKIFGSVFSIISVAFFVFGIIILSTAESPENYTKNGEYNFTFSNIDKETSSTRTSRNRRSTKTKYTPTYTGYVDEQPYTYKYHTVFFNLSQADSFVEKNPTLLVYSYIDDENDIFFLASDMTLEKYFKRTNTLGYIFISVALFLIFFNFVILKYGKVTRNKELLNIT